MWGKVLFFGRMESEAKRDLKVAPIARQINSQRHAEMQGFRHSQGGAGAEGGYRAYT